MHRITIILFSTGIFLLLSRGLDGQNIGNFENNECPGEIITMHFSHECPFAGEILWFKIYCISPGFMERQISSLGFVELVSRENNSVVRKKIDLVCGEGTGELLIPENLSTGIYYVIAYTNWMKNFGENSFFRKKIIIVNPDEPFIPPADTLNLPCLHTSVPGIKDIVPDITIKTDKSIFAARERVHVTLLPGTLHENKLVGLFSASVYRKEPDFSRFLCPDTVTCTKVFLPDIFYFPDYKGVRLSGKLFDQSGNPVSGVRLMMSFPGPGTNVKSCITDSAGKFNFLLKPGKGEEDIVISLPDPSDKISLDDPFWNGFRRVPAVPGIILDRESVEYFREKFTCSQLEKRLNAQLYLKSLPVIKKPDSTVFYQEPFQTVKLGNYIQLDSLGEYFHELMPSALLNIRKGEYNISFYDEKTHEFLDEKPAVFFDGVLFDSYGPIANVPPSAIDRISVLPAAYYYKDLFFGGIVDIHSKKSDFSIVKAQENMTRFIYPKASPEEYELNLPVYSESVPSSGVPDFRYLLCWKPYVKVNDEGTASFDFCTGDIKGTYIIKVTGMADDGEVITAETGITVE